MKKNITFLMIVLILMQSGSYAQNQVKKYYQYINEAELAICGEKYKEAATLYEKAFSTHPPFIIDIRNAITVNYQFLGNTDKTCEYAHLLAQRGHYIYEERTYDSTIKIMLKTIADTTKLITNPELIKILDTLFEVDQNIRSSSDEEDIMAVDLDNYNKIKDLYNRYKNISESTAGNLLALEIILRHNSSWGRPPHDIMLKEVLKGNFDARAYMTLEDICYLNKLHNDPDPESVYYGFSLCIYQIGNTLFIEEPDNIADVNKNRKKINYAETWQNYESKRIYQFQKNHFMFSVPERMGYGSPEDDLIEVEKEKAAIDKEHQENNFSRSYYDKISE